ncbi:HAD-IA family hydrolase [Streptomyces sp. SM12]|uniref:HAD-IA family hydrolase n=1 Tax=Streptomyces sp. SM12 TaxID=1071602 RepID=UPI002155FD2C|nr:HAD-IA family hydrolase [Streptomyces sp. SM12]
MTRELTAHALLLDMDGTLVNSDAVVERVWRRWAARQELEPEAVLAVVHGRQGYATMAELLPGRPVEVNLAENRQLLVEETADMDGVVEIPGAAEFLASLGGVTHALVTSADLPLATARLAAAGLPLPEVRITAESVSASKPDPEGFLKGAAELGVPPEECLALEDSAAGIAAARAAGMRVLGIGPRAVAERPDVAVADLTGVRVHALPGGHVRLTFA